MLIGVCARSWLLGSAAPGRCGERENAPGITEDAMVVTFSLAFEHRDRLEEARIVEESEDVRCARGFNLSLQ